MKISTFKKILLTMTLLTILSACQTEGIVDSEPRPSPAYAKWMNKKKCFEADVEAVKKVNVTPNPNNLLQGVTRKGKWYRGVSGDLTITFGEKQAIYTIRDYDGTIHTRIGDYEVEKDKIEVTLNCFNRVDTLFIKPNGFIEGSYTVNGKPYGEIRLNPLK